MQLHQRLQIGWIDNLVEGIRMKTWEQHYIEHCIKFAEPWGKRFGWAVWHSCFEYWDGCASEYAVLSGVWS